MSRKGAYALRQKPGAEGFAAAWDAALGAPARKVTIDEWDSLYDAGLIHPRFRNGRYLGYRRKPDPGALGRLLRQVERHGRGRRL